MSRERWSRSIVLRLVLACALGTGAAVYAWTGIATNLLVAGPGFVNRIGNTVGTDFGAFYAAGVQAREGGAAALHEVAPLRATHERVVGRPVADYPWPYPPPILLAFAPLSLLPFVPALWTWLALTTGVVVVAATGIVRHPATPVAVLLFPAMAQAAITGPTGTLTGALFTSAFATLPRWPVVAGVLFALLSYKPHLALLVPLCLLAGREWRVMAAFVTGVLSLVAASAMAFGAASWTRFLGEGTAHLRYVLDERLPWMRMPTVFVAVLHATGDDRVAAAAQVASVVGVSLICLRVWAASQDLVARSLVLGTGALLATPYAFDYDSTLLIAPFAYLVRYAARVGLTASALAALVAMWVAPQVVWLCSTWLGQQVGPIVFAGLLLYGAVRAGRTPTPARSPTG